MTNNESYRVLAYGNRLVPALFVLVGTLFLTLTAAGAIGVIDFDGHRSPWWLAGIGLFVLPLTVAMATLALTDRPLVAVDDQRDPKTLLVRTHHFHGR